MTQKPDQVVVVEDGQRITKPDAVRASIDASEDFLRELVDSDYVEACQEIINHFEAAINKRERTLRDAGGEG